MLSRRHLRSKALQALYAYFQSDNNNIAAGEKELTHSIDKVYDLYLFQLSLLPELVDYAVIKMEEAKLKRLPSPDDINPNMRFINNRVIEKLRINRNLRRALDTKKINWVSEQEFTKQIFSLIRETPEYVEYLNNPEDSFENDQLYISKLYKKYISEAEDLESYFEEKSIYWSDDWDLVSSTIIKTIKSFKESSDDFHPISPLYKDEEDDRDFVMNLFRKTIFNNQQFEDIIADKTKNWEVDRIALIDILILKMAMAEVINFPSIPVKVTLNEYIDISKRFSTPKSKTFVNGVLDKIIFDLKRDGKIQKTGRGLIE